MYCARRARCKLLFRLPFGAACTHPSRIPQPLSRDLWETWETGPASPFNGAFSNSPVLHSPDLENLPTSQPAPTKPLCPISHFSEPNYGYYYLFNPSIDRFNYPSVACLRVARIVISAGSWAGKLPEGIHPRKTPQNSENRPSFPRARNPLDGYNQGEQKTAISVPL